MKLIFAVILYVSFFNIAFGQCPNPLTIKYVGGMTASYTGETNDNCQRNGIGKTVYGDPDYFIDYEEGIWVDDLLEGEGKQIHKNGDIFTGLFKAGKLTHGSYLRKSEKIKLTYEGGFNGVLFQGKGYYISENSFNKTVQDGMFISDKFANGIETITSKTDGVVIVSKYVDGISSIIKRNDINTYNIDDIIGDDDFTEIDLIQKGSNFDNRISYSLEIEVDGVKGEWLLDTGAMSFTIGKTLFNRLENQGVEFIDLKKQVVIKGVGGTANGKRVILNNIKIGSYTVNNVVATVSLDNNYSLLGTGFLLKFSNVIWGMRANKLFLYK